MTGLAPHLQNMWLPCVRVLSLLYFNRLIKRGKWYAVRKFIIFDGRSEWLSRTIPTRLVVIMPELFFGYYVVVSVFLCSFILFFIWKCVVYFLPSIFSSSLATSANSVMQWRRNIRQCQRSNVRDYVMYQTIERMPLYLPLVRNPHS